MIVQVFVSQRQAVNALREQFLQRVFGENGVAMIGENEIKNQRILLKNMITGEQEEVDFKGMINKIQPR